MHKYSLLVIVLVFSISFSFAQNTRNTQTPKPPRPVYQAHKKEKKSIFSFLKKKESYKINRTSVEDFRAEVASRQREKAKIDYKVAKVERKEAKKGTKFFGHKRPPKKRPPGKQKFCKVCRIKH